MTSLRGTTRGEPDKGYDAKAAKWRAKLEQRQVTTQAATTQPAAGHPAAEPSADAGDQEVQP